MSPSNSTRWCPTPEQLMILEEMYRGGVRTPNASQIQKITAHLSLYGKIEGKNVFYWFQNHKARERQKLRRKLSKQLYQQQLLQEQFHLHHPPPPPPPNTFLNSFLYASDPPPDHHPMHQRNSADNYLHQDAPTQMIKNYSAWKVDIPANKYEMPNCSTMRTCCDDWVVMMNMKDIAAAHDHHDSCPCCTNSKPLKTLQLFPITTPTAKDQTTATSN